MTSRTHGEANSTPDVKSQTAPLVTGLFHAIRRLGRLIEVRLLLLNPVAGGSAGCKTPAALAAVGGRPAAEELAPPAAEELAPPDDGSAEPGGEGL